MHSSFSATSSCSTFSSACFSSRTLKVFRITVIFKEVVKLKRNHSFNNIFFIQPFQFAIDFRHEVGNFLFVYLNLLNIINYLNQLFFTDLFSGRHFSYNELFTNLSFNISHLTFFAQVDDRD